MEIDVKGALEYEPPVEMIKRYWGASPHTGSMAIMSSRAAHVLFKELLKFLVLTKVLQSRAGKRCAPPTALDRMWHHFLVDDTEVYMTYCERHLGSFVHHRSGGNLISWSDLLPIADELGIELNKHIWTFPNTGGGFDCG